MLKKLPFLLILFFGLIYQDARAVVSFEDNFDLISGVNWNANKQDGSIISKNGVLELRSTGYSFPILYSKNNSLFSSQNNVVFEAKFMFTGVGPMGNGISIGFTGITGWPYYQFSLWNDSTNGLNITYNNFNTYNYNFCNIGVPEDNRVGFISKRLSLDSSVWHKFRIEKNGTQYNLYIDKDYNPNPLVSTAQGQCIPNIIFIGNPFGGGMTSWTSLDIDYIKVGDGLWSEDTRNKIIFLPGMGGSWNEKAMVLNQTVGQSEWKMTPFMKNYNSILSGFNSNGLVKNKDYFVYNYDWRKPLSEQITSFNDYINGLGFSGIEKVDIVGHSLGGIIGRVWTQENPSKVGKVITLASPHAGAVLTYEMWNGAKISNPTDMSSVALNVLLSLQRKNKQTAVETIRSYAPSIKDVLPTFDYLKKNGAVVTPPFNSFLSSKKGGVDSIFDKLLTVSGSGFKTPEWINLGERSIFDSAGQWEQGRPLSYVLADGDGTVLKKSAIFEGDVNVDVVGEHGNVPDKSVNLVLSELGLGKTITTTANNNFNGAVFYLGSPASMKVNCGTGDIDEQEGFVLVSDKNIIDCTVKLVGTDNGVYHLVMGNSSDGGSWQYTEGNIAIGELKNISVKSNTFWYEQILRETNNLLKIYPTNTNLKNMVKAVGSKNRNSLISSYISFRKQKLETIVTWRMINYLEKIVNIEMPNQTLATIVTAKNLALATQSLVNKTASLMQRKKISPTSWQSLNYTQAEELLANPNYGKYILAEKILGIMY